MIELIFAVIGTPIATIIFGVILKVYE